MKYAGFALALGAAGFTVDAQAAELGAVDQPIRLLMRDWTGQNLTTTIAGEILKAAGYKVEYVSASSAEEFEKLASGEIHASLEIWTSSVEEAYAQHVDAGNVVVMGNLGLDAREGLVYPAYVEAECPGLPAWEALRDCAALFGEGSDRGSLMDYPASWGTPGTERVNALNLPFDVRIAESEEEMVTEMRAATKARRPMLMTFWQPHWGMSTFGLRFVKLPDPEPACFSDPAWGPNPNATGDCGFESGAITKAAWSGFAETWPAAYEILSQYQMSVWDQQPLLGLIDVNGESVETAAASWMMVNKKAWRPIVDAALANGS